MISLAAPDVGASDLRVSVWLVEVGDCAEQGERIVELLTPGLTFDVSMPVAGRITGIEKSTGERVQPGDILAWIDPEQYS